MLRADEHELLSRTGRGTPMGELLRRYWIPALLSEELPEPMGRQVRVKLLGEHLLAYRDRSGRVALVGEYCSHRGASLYFGRVEADGIRCSYHGWKYDGTGACTDMPNETKDTNFKSKICHTAYPCEEHAGLVWAYMGPPGTQPKLPELEYLLVPSSHTFVMKRLQECHWTQAQEADVDSSHVPFLHGEYFERSVRTNAPDAKAARWILEDRAPHIEIVPTSYGFVHGSRRKADGDFHYWRINHWLAPWYTLIPAFTGDGALAGHAWIPIDDTKTWVYTFTWHPRRPLTSQERAGMRRGNENYAELMPGSYVPVHNRTNEYVADPNFRPNAQPWQRVTTIQEQDMSMIENMGPGALFDRTQEHTGPADIGVIQLRRRLIAAARAGADSADRVGSDPAAYRVRQISTLLPTATPSWLDAVKPHLEARPETFVAST